VRNNDEMEIVMSSSFSKVFTPRHPPHQQHTWTTIPRPSSTSSEQKSLTFPQIIFTPKKAQALSSTWLPVSSN
jgi:hypothetical protein